MTILTSFIIFSPSHPVPLAQAPTGWLLFPLFTYYTFF